MLYTSIDELRNRLREERRSGGRIGFLPTMGALHEGHLSLARELRNHCGFRVCSIFVNPTQFNDPKDYQAYVINLEQDISRLQKEGVDVVFAPKANEMYQPGFQSEVLIAELTKPFEGEFRPGHFAGVATVVSMLFSIVQPDVAIFGEKDFQQLRIVEQLVADLKFGIEIVRGTLVRDTDGLALSSRNARLSPEGRKNALSISRGIFKARQAFEAGERNGEVLEGLVKAEIQQAAGTSIDYVAVVDEAALGRVHQVSGRCRVLVVARVDGVRLLDNIALHAR